MITFREIWKFNSVCDRLIGAKNSHQNIDYNSALEYNNRVDINHNKFLNNKKDELLNALARYRFFDPDFLMNSDVFADFDCLTSTDCFTDPFFYWHVVNKISQTTANIVDNQVVDVKKIRRLASNLDFLATIHWKQSIAFLKSFELKIEAVDKDAFLLKLNQIKFSSFFYIVKYEIKNEVVRWQIDKNNLSRLSSFDFNITLCFFHEVIREEVLNFIFKLKNSSIENILKKKKKIVLPCDNSASHWQPDIPYKKDDIVFDSQGNIKKYYRCLKDNALWDDYSDWAEEAINSFNFCGSFLNSDEGKKTLSCFNDHIDYFVEKVLGEKICLTLYEDSKNSDFKLNDCFVFDGCKYRIVELIKEFDNKKWVLKIKGVQCLNLTEIDFSKLDANLNKLHEKYQSLASVSIEDGFLIVGFVINDFYKFEESFEVEINV